MRELVQAAIATLFVAACSASSSPGDAADAQAGDSGAPPDAGPADATTGTPHDAAPPSMDATGDDASVTAIALASGSFPIGDGATVTCGTDYDGVQIFYALASAPMPNETGVTPCSGPVIIAPVEANAEYDLDVYLQLGTNVIAQATCTAMTHADATVEASCPPFM